MDHLPPCCASCPEIDQKARACRLLTDLSDKARRRLAGMPCETNRLLKHRFRGHGDAIASQAQAVWEDASADPESLRAGLEAPLDARVWLSAWPAFAPAVGALESHFAAPPQLGTALPPPSSPVLATLAALHGIDPLGHLVLLDGMRASASTATWRAGLGLGDAALADTIALALFRGLVLHTGVLARIEPLEAQVALRERWLTRASESEVAALARAREILGASLTMTDFRAHAQAGAARALELLAADPRLSVVFGPASARALGRALKLSAEAEDFAGFESPLFAFLARELSTADARTPDAHVAPRELVAFALAQSLAADQTLLLVEHLACCRDERCVDVVRAEVIGAASVRRLLSGPMTTASSWPARQDAPAGWPQPPALRLESTQAGLPVPLGDDEEDTLPRGERS